MKQYKTCTKCNQGKKIIEFYPDRNPHSSKCGHKPQCKTCQKKQRKIYLFSEKGKAVTKRYSKTERSKIRQKRYTLRHPERRKAKGAVFTAISAGKLVLPKTLKCKYCPNQAEQYHHWSYLPEHWLDVIPVCQKCHKKIHRRKKAI